MWFVYVLYLLVCFCVSGLPLLCFFFFFNDTATTEIYTLSLHDALPISRRTGRREYPLACLVLGILRTLLGRALCRSMAPVARAVPLFARRENGDPGPISCPQSQSHE